MTFDDRQLGIIQAALRLAGFIYRDDARVLRGSNQTRLAAQFERQALAASWLDSLIENRL